MDCKVFQENVTPKEVKLQVPFQFLNFGTDFVDAFDKAYKLMAKYVVNSKIKFILMAGSES